MRDRDFLDGHVAMEQVVGGTPNRAHATAAQVWSQAVPAADESAVCPVRHGEKANALRRRCVSAPRLVTDRHRLVRFRGYRPDGATARPALSDIDPAGRRVQICPRW
ncbi:hypothetical protein GCM10020369_62350 [Cryptosporangium minutisporangium]|uniref:Uncharacterized protein n=1 Tax=Cryptosporangium minutisporangium TaxID=113569 RepID=A0ABP6T620_9ACTN